MATGGLLWQWIGGHLPGCGGGGGLGVRAASKKVHRVHMELGGKLLNSLKIKTQFLERLQSVSAVDGAARPHPKG